LTCWRLVQNGPGNQQHQLQESLGMERHASRAISIALSDALHCGNLRANRRHRFSSRESSQRDGKERSSRKEFVAAGSEIVAEQ
jgi:hypothetical protein